MDVYRTVEIDVWIRNEMVVGLRFDLPDKFRQFGLGSLESYPGFVLLSRSTSAAEYQGQQTEWHEQMFDLKNQIIIHTFVLKFISRFLLTIGPFSAQTPNVAAFGVLSVRR